MISRFENLLYQISEIDHIWHKIAGEEMEEYGLKGSLVLYFTSLAANPDGMTAAQLSERCCRDKADVSRAMAALEKKGFVERRGEAAYRAQLVLTQKGNEVAKTVNRKVTAAVELAGKGVSEEHRRIFYDVLHLIVSNLQELEKSGLPNINQTDEE